MTDELTARLFLGSRREEIEPAQRHLLQAARTLGFAEASCYAIRAATTEALLNAIEHGNKVDAAKQVTLAFTVDRGRVTIEVQDEGKGFDPEAVPDPTRGENLSLPSGRGLALMRAFMSEVEFSEPGNRVRMTYLKSKTQPRSHAATQQ